MSIRAHGRGVGVLAVVVGALVTASPAYGSVGVGVGAATLTSRHAVKPGSTVALPSWWVQNTGTERMGYRLTAVPHADLHDKPMPTAWVSVARTIQLLPGRHTLLAVRVHVPAGTAGGTYEAYLLARATTVAGSGTRAAVGAAAATEVRLAVSAPAGSSHQALAVVGGLAAAAAAVVIAFSRARRRRRDPSSPRTGNG